MRFCGLQHNAHCKCGYVFLRQVFVQCCISMRKKRARFPMLCSPQMTEALIPSTSTPLSYTLHPQSVGSQVHVICWSRTRRIVAVALCLCTALDTCRIWKTYHPSPKALRTLSLRSLGPKTRLCKAFGLF